MPIIRWLIIGVAVWLVIVLVRHEIGRRFRTTPNSPATLKKSKVTSDFPVVVACHYCNLHVPKTEAIQQDSRYYCSNQHRDAEIAHSE